VVAVAVIGHDFADGFNTYTVTSLYGNDRRRALTLLTADAVAPVRLLRWPSRFPIAYSVCIWGSFAGFLMYLASADILPRAHTGRRTPVTLACTIGGVLFMLVIVGLASKAGP
jgi:zinc transporter, ZIP family